MKVEIVDREYWLTRVEFGLAYIDNIRDQENKRMEALPWYRQMFLGTFDYPSNYKWMTACYLENLREALLMDKTGVIYLDNREIEALRWCESVYN